MCLYRIFGDICDVLVVVTTIYACGGKYSMGRSARESRGYARAFHSIWRLITLFAITQQNNNFVRTCHNCCICKYLCLLVFHNWSMIDLGPIQWMTTLHITAGLSLDKCTANEMVFFNFVSCKVMLFVVIVMCALFQKRYTFYEWYL